MKPEKVTCSISLDELELAHSVPAYFEKKTGDDIVTPQMLRAGVAAYLDWYETDDYSEENLARIMFLAMRTLER